MRDVRDAVGTVRLDLREGAVFGFRVVGFGFSKALAKCGGEVPRCGGGKPRKDMSADGGDGGGASKEQEEEEEEEETIGMPTLDTFRVQMMPTARDFRLLNQARNWVRRRCLLRPCPRSCCRRPAW